MSVEDDLYAALKDLVGGRVERVQAGPRTAAPYIVFQQVGGIPKRYVENVMPDKRNGRFRCTTWAKTLDEAVEISRSTEQRLIESALLSATPETALTTTSDPAAGLFGAWQDFSIWF